MVESKKSNNEAICVCLCIKFKLVDDCVITVTTPLVPRLTKPVKKVAIAIKFSSSTY